MDWSRTTARELLAGVGGRLRHVEAVGRRAEEIAGMLPVEDRAALVAAAYLHDVGYAPPLRFTGLHPIDGARWLRANGVDGRVCNLVAHHSGARLEGEERGLLVELEDFDLEAGPVMNALVFADMTTGPDGGYVSFEERLDDILARYPPDARPGAGHRPRRRRRCQRLGMRITEAQMSMRVLTSGIDSLYFSVRAPVRAEAWELLKRAKDGPSTSASWRRWTSR